MVTIYEEFSEEEKNILIKNNKTYIRKFSDFENKNLMNDLKLKIKNYNFEKFEITFDGFQVNIIVDNNFKILLNELNNKLNINFELSIDKSRLNTINLDFILPLELRGLDIGYKIYKLMVKKFDFITSDYGSSVFAKNVWYKLISNKDYYAFTSGTILEITRGCSGVINKNITDIKLKEILDILKLNIYKIYNINFEDIEFDKYLLEKIKSLYGNN